MILPLLFDIKQSFIGLYRLIETIRHPQIQKWTMQKLRLYEMIDGLWIRLIKYNKRTTQIPVYLTLNTIYSVRER